MTVDARGETCSTTMGETKYTFLVIKHKEKKNIEIARHKRADYYQCVIWIPLILV
jgi:hypothetical protein